MTCAPFAGDAGGVGYDESEAEMTTTGTDPVTTPTRDDRLEVYPDEAPGTGWLFFAGSMMGLAGLMRLLDSFWAFRYKGALPDGLQNAALGSNLKHYAWAWLFVGIILLASSFLILVRSQLARWVGYLAATIAAVSAMAWMPYYPVWSLTYIGIAVLTFYALARYGGRPGIRVA